jgi:putative metallohydrolase (TIGR04338 family)
LIVETKTQQHALYRAERDLPVGETFASEAAVQDYVNELIDSWWWQRFFWRVQHIEVQTIRGSRALARWDEDANCGVVGFPPAHRHVKSITHELAHVLADALRGSRAHDPEYARMYARLVSLISGPDAWVTLQRGYEREKIEYLQEGS